MIDLMLQVLVRRPTWNNQQLHLWPSQMQVVGCPGRANKVQPALHSYTWNVPDGVKSLLNQSLQISFALQMHIDAGLCSVQQTVAKHSHGSSKSVHAQESHVFVFSTGSVIGFIALMMYK